MTPLSVIFAYFSVFPFGGKNQTLESGNTLIGVGLNSIILTHKKILKNRP